MDNYPLITQHNKYLVLLLGSNIGNKKEYLDKAILRLTKILNKPLYVSKQYETAPWGNTDQENFMNQAVVYQANEEPLVLLDVVLGIEQELGRKRDKADL